MVRNTEPRSSVVDRRTRMTEADGIHMGKGDEQGESRL